MGRNISTNDQSGGKLSFLKQPSIFNQFSSPPKQQEVDLIESSLLEQRA